MSSPKPVISFDNVSVFRGDKNVLRDITLRIHSGENVAVLGPNGSGKSTLMKTITRELYPSAGEIRMFGKKAWDVFELRSRIGIVSYDLQALFAQDITGREVVLSGFFTSIGLWKNNRVTPDMEKKAAKVMRWLGIDALKNRAVTRLSSGEARRFLIARALIHEPGLIIFDEPMNSLDLGAQATVKASLRKLARAGVGVVLVTHQLSDIIPEISRIVLLKQGRVAADGDKTLIITPKILANLFGTRVSLAKEKGYFHAIS